MGFFDKLLGRDWAWYLAKAKKNMEAEDLGEALACIRKAQELAGTAGDEAANAQIAETEDTLKGMIYKKAYEQARQYLRCGQADSAKTALERAAKYVRNDAERDALNQLVDDSHHWEEEKVVEAHVEGEERVSGLDTDDKWNLYVTSLPFAKAEHIEKLGAEFKKAWIALQEGDFDEAIPGLESIYKEHAEDSLVMAELGRAYYGKGRLENAADMLEKADAASADIETKLLRVEIMWAMKRFEDAEEVLQSAHDMDPENVQVLARIAQHGLISHDYESGIAAVEVLLDSIPNDISVQRLAGRLYMESGDEDKALECYETVNRIYWQVNPQTHKLTFDQNCAAAAANIYFKKRENLDRCVELLEAVRANSTGETHVAMCLQLAEVYEIMNRRGKRTEVLHESTRFMDELMEQARGPEKAMLQLQYSEVAEKLDDAVTASEMIQSAREFFAADAEKGQPVARFYLDIIDKKLQGEPFPTAAEMQERMNQFAQQLMASRNREREAAQEAQQLEIHRAVAEAQEKLMANADDILRKMASMASSEPQTVVSYASDEEDYEASEDEAEESEESDDEETNEE